MITHAPLVGHANFRHRGDPLGSATSPVLQSFPSGSQVLGPTLFAAEGRTLSSTRRGPPAMSTATHRPTPRHQLNLHGQAHLATGPLDLNGMYMAHHAFRRDLARFALAARQTPVEARDVWRALAVRWEQFAGILHHHHTTEDAV